ncbi:hypothetical protein MA20_11415 [Bradyrhizobium japonicum]|uniref:Uncharacterized protein n=1 Tax=Bradyrhizobium japonicum TaxID=375 RepID=A0A0A3Y2D0_BRAJP|nr:hypothetical protein [Bradyrhizobium japonicum]KGT79501.1 hypothetical protein MA20_11415 [Bradyrhizobium japonicum]
MAYTLTIFPEDGGVLPHKLEEATSDQAAITEARKIVEGRLGDRGADPFVVREDGKVFISRVRYQTALSWSGVTRPGSDRARSFWWRFGAWALGALRGNYAEGAGVRSQEKPQRSTSPTAAFPDTLKSVGTQIPRVFFQ